MVITSVAAYSCSLIAFVIDMNLVAIVFDGRFPFLYSAFVVCSSYKTQRENNNEFICFYRRQTLSLSW